MLPVYVGSVGSDQSKIDIWSFFSTLDVCMEFELCSKVYSLVSVYRKASNLVKWLLSTWSFMWWCQFIEWLKFETHPVLCPICCKWPEPLPRVLGNTGIFKDQRIRGQIIFRERGKSWLDYWDQGTLKPTLQLWFWLTFPSPTIKYKVSIS